MKKKKIWIIIIIFIIFALLSSFFLFKNLNKDKDGKKNDDNFYENTESNILDWSSREKEVREKTGNKYYTINNSLRFSRDRDFELLHLKSIWLIRAAEKVYSFSAELINDSGTDSMSQKVVIVFLKEDGSTIAEVEAVIPAVKNGETGILYATTSHDVLYAYNFTIKKVLDTGINS